MQDEDNFNSVLERYLNNMEIVPSVNNLKALSHSLTNCLLEGNARGTRAPVSYMYKGIVKSDHMLCSFFS